MKMLRRRLSLLASAWLLVQASTIATVSASACAEAAAATTAVVCTCTHADGAECPMHHTQRQSKPRCSCRSVDEGVAGGVFVLFSAPGVPPSSASASMPLASQSISPTPRAGRLARSSVPDPPPPRRALR